MESFIELITIWQKDSVSHSQLPVYHDIVTLMYPVIAQYPNFENALNTTISYAAAAVHNY